MEKVSNTTKLKKLIDRYEYISFDVFDTLIKRNCENPKDIFRIVENEFNKTSNVKLRDFYKKRIDAEIMCRNIYTDVEDITIDQIYNKIDYSSSISKKLQELEINVELDFCITNQLMYEIYEYCIQKNKKIIIASDMYLNTTTIDNILMNNGFTGYKLYVSSEIKKTKLTGNLFKYILDDLRIYSSQVLHIGDSWKADYISPMRLGIKSFHIKKKINNFSYINKKMPISDINTNIMVSLINNNVLSCKNDYERFGYEILGPLCVNFCYWLDFVTQKNGINNLLFCARDMKMIQEIFNIYFGNKVNNSYFYVSRRSTYLPYLYVKKDYKSFCDLIPVGKIVLTFNELLNLYNIKIDEKELNDGLKKYGFSIEKKYNFERLKDNDSFINFYKEFLLNYINVYGEEQYKCFNNYLNSLGFNANTGIVDLGWRGTTQNIMIEITKKNVFGFYFGLHSLNGEKLNSNNIETYLFYKQNNNYSEKVYPFMSLFELLMSALHGSTISYKNDDIPYILDESANENCIQIECIQNAAMMFSKDLLKYKKYIHYNDNKYFIDSFINVGINPSYNMAKTLGSIYTENIKVRRLCEYKGLLYYILHMKTLKEDIIDSEWKIGFMKQLLKIDLPYYKIYKKIKDKR